ncbi:hypothetical protein B9Z65_5172 [Elsinoe australis]|uniref:Rhodopsin domain-containing protein n=1 Tax=Elsinoe australis TaxID=40998 RepID=A0A2P7ZDA3_9PEZI|nr:hypothetical protein B9Z65_5172 [Elsinoe australis]
MTWIINGSAALLAQSKYDKIIACALATSLLMLITVTLRAYVRLKIVKSMGADDCYRIASLGYAAGGVVQTRYGLGLPPALYPLENQLMSLKLNYAFRFLYCIAVSFFKFALCFSYLRITNRSLSMRTYRKIILGTMAFTFSFMIYYCAIVIFACTPIYKYWHRQIPGKCLPSPVVYISPAAITIVVDVVLFVLPIPLVLPLRMNRRRKIGLIMAFFLGFITTLCSVLRLRGTVHVPQTGDPQYLIRWAIAEANIGIVTTSLPTLAPLLKSSLFRGAQGTSSHSSRDRPIRAALAERTPVFIKNPASVVISTVKRTSANIELGNSDEWALRSNGTRTSRKSTSGSESDKTYSKDFEGIPMPFITKTTEFEITNRPMSEDLESFRIDVIERLRTM